MPTPNPVQTALKFEEAGGTCSQAVLCPFATRYGLNEEAALRLATSFGGGMGRLGEVCGAVTGAFMVIGLHAGTSQPADKPAKERCYALVQDFAARFKQQFGSLLCRELTGFELCDPGQLQQARTAGVFKTRCPQFVQAAVELLQKMTA